VAETGGRAGRLHARRVSAKQRLHLAAFLILAAALPLRAQQAGSDFDFTDITTGEFAKFSRIVAQGMYATPVEPATSRGILAFDVGVAVTAVPVDTSASYWRNAVRDDFTVSDYLAVPRIVASKGLSVATVSASYAKLQDSDLSILGAAVDVPLIRGGIAVPSLTVRGAYSQLQGVDNFDATSMGVEVFLAKGFGPITPYVAVGRMRADTSADRPPDPLALQLPLTHESDFNRYTAGVRISLMIPKIVVEATQAEERSYAAKLSFGLF
jgi:hypothetical protein